eukprot:jgi/Galph1/1262/GphlegSOOS_G6092.1
MSSLFQELTKPKTPKLPAALECLSGTAFPVACSRLYPDRDVDIYALNILPFDNERKAVVSAGDSAAHVIDLSTTLTTVSLPEKVNKQVPEGEKNNTSPTLKNNESPYSTGLLTRVVQTSVSKHGPARRTFLEHKGAVLAVDCAIPSSKPDEPVVLTGSVAELGRVWFPRSLEQVAVLRGHRGPVYGVALSYSVDRALTASGDSTVRFWLIEDVQKRALLTSPKTLKKGGSLKQVWSSRKAKSDVSEEETGGARPLAVLRGHSGEVFTVEVIDERPSGGVLRAVSGGEDSVVQVWDLEEKTIFRSLYGHEKKIYAVAVPRTVEKELCGRIILSSSGDKTCRIWDVQATNPLVTILEGHDDEVWGCAVSSQCRYALSCTVGGSAYLWDLRKSSQPLSILHSRNPLRCCACAPSNRTFHAADIKGNIYHIYIGGESCKSVDIDNARPPGSFGYELRGISMSRNSNTLRSTHSVGHNMAHMEYLYTGRRKSKEDTHTTWKGNKVNENEANIKRMEHGQEEERKVDSSSFYSNSSQMDSKSGESNLQGDNSFSGFQTSNVKSDKSQFDNNKKALEKEKNCQLQ